MDTAIEQQQMQQQMQASCVNVPDDDGAQFRKKLVPMPPAPLRSVSATTPQQQESSVHSTSFAAARSPEILGNVSESEVHLTLLSVHSSDAHASGHHQADDGSFEESTRVSRCVSRGGMRLPEVFVAGTEESPDPSFCPVDAQLAISSVSSFQLRQDVASACADLCCPEQVAKGGKRQQPTRQRTSSSS